MKKKDYAEIAKIVHNIVSLKDKEKTAKALASYFMAQNDKFKSDKFIDSCFGL